MGLCQNLLSPLDYPGDFFDPMAIAMDIPTMNEPTPTEPAPSYVKLAMRNMVRKKWKSLWHFFLTVSGLMAFLVGISYLTR